MYHTDIHLTDQLGNEILIELSSNDKEVTSVKAFINKSELTNDDSVRVYPMLVHNLSIRYCAENGEEALTEALRVELNNQIENH